MTVLSGYLQMTPLWRLKVKLDQSYSNKTFAENKPINKCINIAILHLHHLQSFGPSFRRDIM